MENKQRGILFVVSAPSGAGKTSLCKAIAGGVNNLHHSVSYTTRAPRPGEREGRDYFFVDMVAFRAMAEKNQFAEWAEVHGNLYGTSRERLMEVMDQGIDVILDIDAQGAMQVKKRYKDAIFIYILPPSYEILKQRLTERRSDSPDEIRKRLRKAREEIWNYREYYYLIVNDVFQEAQENLRAVIIAERIKMKRMNLLWIEENFIKNKEVD
jgi:guanylate kinase